MPSKKKKNSFLNNLEEKIIFLFKKVKKPLLLREIYHLLHIPTDKRKEVRDLIKDLTEKGKLVQIRKRKYGLPEHLSIVKGKLRVHPEGFGFVETEDGETVFIPPRKIGRALDGDIVLQKLKELLLKDQKVLLLMYWKEKEKTLLDI